MITSKTNSLIKQIRSLSDKKFRDRLSLFVLEGIKPVKEALALSYPVFVVVATTKGAEILGEVGVRTEIVSDQVFDFISEEKTPQGVLAILYKPENQMIAPNGACLFLDGVSDPSNVGAIIRTAAASGYNTVYLNEGCADAYSQKAVRSSMSGVLRVKIVRGQTEEILKCIDKPLVIADMGGENVFDFKKKGEYCLVIGNEGKGVTTEVKALAEYTVSIPMQNGVESLNASVSAGILMYLLK